MRKKELIVIGIIVLVLIGVIVLKNKNKNKQIDDTQTSTSSQGEVQKNGDHVQMTEDGTKVNTSSKLAEKKVVNGIEFSNIQLTENSGETVLIATVKNTKSEKSEMFAVDVTLVDESGAEITTLPGLIAPLEPGATSQFSSSTTLDFANAYDFRVTAK